MFYDGLMAELGPQGWWKLADPVGSTTAADSSGNGYVGTVTGTVTFGETGPITGSPGDTAALFGTSSAEITLGSAADCDQTTGSFSFGIWYKAAASATSSEPFYKGGIASTIPGYAIEIASATQLTINASDGTTRYTAIQAGTTLDSGTWHFLVGVVNRSSGTMTAYVDGVAGTAESISAMGSVTAPSTTLRIGDSAALPTLAQAFVIDTALTAAQIAQLYESAPTGFVQQQYASSNGAASVSLVLPDSVTAGDFLVATAGLPPNVSVESITDDVSYYDGLVQSLSPVGWWKLADPVGSTTAADSSGNGYVGTVTGTVTFGETGPITGSPGDTAALFGTSSAEITLGSAADCDQTTGSFSFGIWYKAAASATSSEPFYKGGIASTIPGYAIEIASATQLTINASDGTTRYTAIQAGTTLDSGTWHFLVGVVNRSSGTMTAYVDGVAGTAESISAMGSVTAPSTTLRIGDSAALPTLAQAFVIDTALTAAQIAALYAAAPVATPSNRWIQASYAASDGGNAEIWYARGVQGGQTDINVSLSTAASVDVNVSEWSGIWYVDPLDQWSQNIGTSSITAQPVQPRSNGELFLAATSCVNSIANANSPYAALTSNNSAGHGFAYQIASGSISSACTWDQNPLSPYDTYVASLGPVAWWKLADAHGASVAVDSSGNGHSASVHTGGSITFGEAGIIPGDTCASFNGASVSYLEAASVNITSDLSIVAWVNPTNPNVNDQSVVSNDNGTAGYGLNLYYPVIIFETATTVLQTDVIDAFNGGWHMIVATWTSADGASRLFVDNEYIDGVYTDAPGTSSSHVFIGDNYYGELAQVALFDTALSVDQINTLYTNYNGGEWAVAEACFVSGAAGLNPNFQFPETLVEISTTDNYLAPLEGYGVWTNISSYTRNMSLGPLGRQHELDRVQATTGTFTLDNRSGEFNTWNTESFLYNSGYGLKPMNPMKVTTAWDGITYPKYYGYFQSITNTITDVLNVDATLNCVDILQILSLKYLTNDLYAQSILSDNADALEAYYRLGDPFGVYTVSDASGNGYTGSLTAGSVGTPAYGADGVFLYDADTALDLTNGSNSSNGGFSTRDYSTQPPTQNNPLDSASTWTLELWCKWTSSEIPAPAIPPTPVSSSVAPVPNAVLLHCTTAAGSELEILAGWFPNFDSSIEYYTNKTLAVTYVAGEPEVYYFTNPPTNIFDGNWHHIVVSIYTSVGGLEYETNFLALVDGNLITPSDYFNGFVTPFIEPLDIYIGTPPTGVVGIDVTGSDIYALPYSGVLDEVCLYSDNLSLFNAEQTFIDHYNQGLWFQEQEYGAIEGDVTAGRLNKVLEVCGLDPSYGLNVPYPFRTLLYGETNSVTTTSGLNYLQTQTETEPGLIFQGADGLIYAYNCQYQYLNPTSTVSQGVFGDSPSAGYYYNGPALQITGDDLDIWNDIQVQSGRSAVVTEQQYAGVLQEWGPSQSSVAAISASVYGNRTLQGLTSLQEQYDSDALALAQNYAVWYNNPISRVTQIQIDSYANGGENIPQMLGRGLMDRITIEYQGQTPGPQFQQDSLIEQISDNVTMDGGPSWTTVWAMSPYEILMYPTYLGVWKFGNPASEGVLTL